MKLKVLILSKILVDEDVKKVVAEAENGSFCLLPRHIDFVASLVPGILTFEAEASGEEEFLALEEGILVKRGQEILVSTTKAVRSKQLEGLRKTLEEEFHFLEEQEKKSRSTLLKLETDFARRIFRLRE